MAVAAVAPEDSAVDGEEEEEDGGDGATAAAAAALAQARCLPAQ